MFLKYIKVVYYNKFYGYMQYYMNAYKNNYNKAQSNIF